MANIFILTSSNLSSLSYTVSDSITIQRGATLTMNSTPSVNPGTITAQTGSTFQILNSSLTTPIVLTLSNFTNSIDIRNGSTFYVSGAMMTLGTGDGVNKLTWDFKTLYSGKVPGVAYAEVESSAGSNDYYPWPVIPIDPLFYGYTRSYAGSGDITRYAGKGEISKVLFWHDTNKVLSSGDGLTGSLIPNGCKVRIPNIYITNTLAPDAASYFRLQTTENWGSTYLGNTNATTGTFTLTAIDRATSTTIGTTSELAYSASAAAVKTALENVLGTNTVANQAGGPLPAAITFNLSSSYATIPLALSATLQSTYKNTTNPANPPPIIFTLDNSILRGTLINLSGDSAVGANNGGNFIVSNLSIIGKIKFSTSYYGPTFYAHRFGLYGGDFVLYVLSSNVTLDYVSTTQHPHMMWDTSAVLKLGLSYVLGDVSLNRCVYSCYGQIVYFFNCRNIKKFDDVKVYTFSGQNYVNYNVIFDYIQDTTVNRLVSIGRCTVGISRCKNLNIISPRQAIDSGRPWNIQTTSRFFISDRGMIVQYCDNIKIYDWGHAFNDINNNSPIDNVPGWTPYQIDASTNISLISSSIEGANTALTHGLMTGVSKNVNFINLKKKYARPGSGWPIIFYRWPYQGPIVAKKLFYDYRYGSYGQIGAMNGSVYDLVTANLNTIYGYNYWIDGGSNPSGNQGAVRTFSDYVGGNFADMFVSNSSGTGNVVFGGFGNGSSLILSGTSYVNTGVLYMPNDGDGATAEIPFAMHAIDSFKYSDPLFVGNANGIASKSATLVAPGGPTGGTFTVTVYNNSGSLIGTTTALNYNASNTTIQTALRTAAGDSTISVAAGSLPVGFNITNTSAKAYSYDINGSNLTGGAEPGKAYIYNKANFVSTDLIPRKIKVELQVKNAEDVWPTSWIQLGIGTAPGNLASCISNLVNYRPYDNNSGLKARLRFTCTDYDPYRFINMYALPTNISPQKWDPADSTITLSGTNPTDLTQMIRYTDDRVLTTFTGSGTKLVCVAGNYGVPVYFNRMDSSQNILMSTYPTTQSLTLGDNGTVNLYYGDQYQIGDSSVTDISTANFIVTSRLDAKVSSIIPTTSGSTLLTKGQFLALK